jgi:hypothetical protein
MPLSRRSGRRNDRRSARWTVAILGAGLLTACALGIGVARSLVQAHPSAGGRQASAIGDPAQRTVPAGHTGSSRSCPTGSAPHVVIEEVQVRPALEAGLWLRPGRSRITIRGRLVNDTSAAITVRGVPLTVVARPWRAHTRFARVVDPYSSEAFLARGTMVITARERMALAARLSWAWHDRHLQTCGLRGLVEDD